MELCSPFSDFDRFFEEAFGARQPIGRAFREKGPQVLSPRLDIWENEGGFELRVELPGVAREDVQITTQDRTLLLSAEAKNPVSDSSENKPTSLRFRRRVQLPSNIDTDRIEAKIADGLLTILLPKSVEAQPRSIEVR
jgi:HSP20 family protein